MNHNVNIIEIQDNGGRRSGIDRRRYSYSGHIPERRDGFDRREQADRRKVVDIIEFQKEREARERRKAWSALNINN